MLFMYKKITFPMCNCGNVACGYMGGWVGGCVWCGWVGYENTCARFLQPDLDIGFFEGPKTVEAAIAAIFPARGLAAGSAAADTAAAGGLATAAAAAAAVPGVAPSDETPLLACETAPLQRAVRPPPPPPPPMVNPAVAQSPPAIYSQKNQREERSGITLMVNHSTLEPSPPRVFFDL